MSDDMGFNSAACAATADCTLATANSSPVSSSTQRAHIGLYVIVGISHCPSQLRKPHDATRMRTVLGTAFVSQRLGVDKPIERTHMIKVIASRQYFVVGLTTVRQ